MANVTIQEPKFYKADDVAKMLDVSVASAYRIIQKINAELEAQGYLTIRGRVSQNYFNKKVSI